jgi:hypothetical protein
VWNFCAAAGALPSAAPMSIAAARNRDAMILSMSHPLTRDRAAGFPLIENYQSICRHRATMPSFIH